MSLKFDVALISVFGRSHWLASELAEKGLKVALVDVSSHMGRWTPEDWEGPFGLFHADVFSASQKERLSEDDYHESIDEGFVLWLKSGPIDLKGPLASFWMEKYNLKGPLLTYLSAYDNLSTAEKKDLQQGLAKWPYQQKWFALLAHQLARHVYIPNEEALSYGRPLSLFSPYSVRRVSRRGLEKSLSWCEQKGVKVYQNVQVVDMQKENKSCAAIEIQSSHSEILNSHHFIWSLSSEETYRFPNKFSETFFPSGPTESQWCWMRFRIKLKDTSATNILPLKFMMIKDLHLPWTHENMCLVQKTVQEHTFDVWLRIPTQHRFQKAYLENVKDEIIGFMADRIPDSDPTLIDMPQDYHYEYSELGAPRFPVYDPVALKKLSKAPFENVYYDGPEYWKNLDWAGQFEYQSSLFEKIMEKGEAR